MEKNQSATAKEFEKGCRFWRLRVSKAREKSNNANPDEPLLILMLSKSWVTQIIALFC